MNENNGFECETPSSGGVEFSSTDCIDIIMPGPGDTTIRPSQGVAREAGLALIAKMERLKKLAESLPPDEGGQES